MKKMFVMMALSLFAAAAHAESPVVHPEADPARPLWACALAFEGEAYGIQVLVGTFRSVAVGEIRCTDSLGGRYVRPVRITMNTRPVALSLGIGEFSFAGVTGQISLFNAHPDVLLGRYYVARGHVALIAGAGAFTAVKADLPQLALQVSLQVGAGWGAHMGVQRMMIEALN